MASKWIDLKTLVSEEQFNFIEFIENNDHFVSSITIRGMRIKYYTYNKRLLWIANGLEHIEPELLDWIDSIHGEAVFFDIGASNGPFSIYAAMKRMQVVAFEPEAQNFAVLEMNHYLNNQFIQHPIIALNLALSDINGLGKLYCNKYEGGMAQKILDKTELVLTNEQFTPNHTQYVMKETLDEVISKYDLPFPEYIKIDVDGSEENVINGAMNTLRSNYVKSIFIELQSPNQRVEDHPISKKLINLNFRVGKIFEVPRFEGLYNCIFEKV